MKKKRIRLQEQLSPRLKARKPRIRQPVELPKRNVLKRLNENAHKVSGITCWKTVEGRWQVSYELGKARNSWSVYTYDTLEEAFGTMLEALILEKG